ncbi:MAG: response regulator transcription factor [Holosporales bacterium]|jgi:two-component system OmpR family response regulator
MKILVIDDDATQAHYIVSALQQAGHSADHASDGFDGLHMASEGHYDVLVVDRMLPKLDGLGLLTALRASGKATPALVLSALSSVEERVRGLKAGGDDYLTKPFAFSELIARLEVLARRTSPHNVEATHLQCHNLTMNLLTREVRRAGTLIPLQNREFRLLEYLLRHAGQVVTRTMLLEAVWDFHFFPETNIIDAQISKLRAKIDKGHDKPLLHTVRGTGYKLGVAT